MALVLLVDDNRDLRRSVHRFLAVSGHDVLEAGDGDEALDLVRQHHPDLVITDVIMPKKDGIETILEIRRERLPVKILVMSGSDPVGAHFYLAAAAKLGADAVMRKPLHVSEFQAVIDRLLAN
ncbi:MAG TPA: response regulator [Stellaceae bacterium]|nr:response regulator [Stellaceae bacterium]